jgi:hypothetical protein
VSRTPFILRILLVVGLLAGCGGASPSPGSRNNDPSGTTTFIAQDGDFSGFENWTHFDLDGALAGNAHVAGPRTIYVKQLPPHGSTTFPVGTMIVKVLSNGQILSMVKRGGDFNAQGAVGWEWFELGEFRGGPFIVWRGVAPPTGEVYAGIAGGTCNSCHMAATANDSVQAAPLQLSNF